MACLELHPHRLATTRKQAPVIMKHRHKCPVVLARRYHRNSSRQVTLSVQRRCPPPLLNPRALPEVTIPLLQSGSWVSVLVRF